MRALLSQLFAREIRGLHEAAYLLAIFAFGSQLLALVRDRFLAGTFGAGTELDLYFAAFRIPDLLFALVASFVSVYVLVPFLQERASHSVETVRTFLGSVLLCYTGVMGVLVAVVFLAAPWLCAVLYPAFTGEERELLVALVRILLLQPFLLGLSNLTTALVQFRQRFILYALAPIFYNAGIIFGIVVLVPAWGLHGLVAGVVCGAALHLGIQLPFVLADAVMPRMWLRAPDLRAVWSVVKVSLPRTLTLSSQQVVLLVLASMAAMAGTGGITAFNLAYNLQAVPLTIIGVSYSVAAFPTLVRLYQNGELDRFFVTVTTAIRHILFWSLPAMALLLVLRAHLVRVILGTGEFGWNDTKLTAACLALFSLSLAAQAIVILLVRGSYAMGNTRTPLIVTLGSSVLTIVLAHVFMRELSAPGVQGLFEALLRAGGVASSGVLALALAYSVGMWVNAIGLLLTLPHGFRRVVAACAGTFFRSLAAGLAGGFAAFLIMQVTATQVDMTTFLGIALHGALAGIGGLGVWVLVAYALGSAEIIEGVRALRARFWKAAPIGMP